MAVVKISLKSGGYAYIVRLRDANKKWYPSKTFEKKGDAQDYEDHLKEGRSKGAKAHSGSKITLNEYWNKWKEDRGIEWGVSYKRDSESRFENHVKPILGDKLIVEIDSSAISTLMADLKQKGLSASTRNCIHNCLNRMFRDAVDFYEILLKNPVRKDQRAKLSKIKRSHWTPQECFRFLESVREHQYGVAYWIMLWNGFRIGEILALRYGDLDLENGVFHIKRQYSKNEYVEKELKNKVEYSPKMAGPLHQFLLEKLPKKVDPDLLVIGSKRGKFTSYKTVSSHLTKAAKAVGLKKLTPHELRHSMTGLWIQIGATERDLQELLNHQSTVSTRGYMHYTPERIDDLAAKLKMPECPVIH